MKPEPSTFEVRNELFAPDGKLLQTFKKKVTLKAGETRRMELQSKLISNPELWTPETLILYKVVTSLVDTKTRKAIDRIIRVRYNSPCDNYFGNAGVAQLAEQLICNQQVGGSIPLASSKIKFYLV